MNKLFLITILNLIPIMSNALSFELKHFPANTSSIAIDLYGSPISYYDHVKNSCHIQIYNMHKENMDSKFKATYFKAHIAKDSLFSKGYSQLRFEGQNQTGQQILIICRAQDRILDTNNSQFLSVLGEFN